MIFRRIGRSLGMFRPDRVRIASTILDEEGHGVALPLERLPVLLPSAHRNTRVYSIATSAGRVFVEAPNRLVSGDGFTDVASAERAVRIAADMLCQFDFTDEPAAPEDRVLFKSPHEMLGVEYLRPGVGLSALLVMTEKTPATDQTGTIVVSGRLGEEEAWVSARGLHILKRGEHDLEAAVEQLNAILL